MGATAPYYGTSDSGYGGNDEAIKGIGSSTENLPYDNLNN